ncbi:MAG: FAD-dependent oxidoreductase [Xenococcaceae cyanobacterium MO_234.B1]|nr:FAD-dependent oxidoreductase [Xenococcaceae cyanobacterium MO_234.B1]
MAKPWYPIYFAGEHTATFSSGMESVLESAERVVAEVVAKST